MSDDTQPKRGVVVSMATAKSLTFAEAVSDQELARDRIKDPAQWQQEISQSAYAADFPILAAAVIEQGLPPSLFRALCQTLLENRWIADAIARDIPNLDKGAPDAN
ncbi:hypothetical protein [Phyllobacterium zundukense]|uniref:Uncharacterized protein n=1 Tax=Phyllobacterium zundukense TaxID=1867719 RepID=A0A2N9W4U6_9HYPH|nr:hypothetical protein [Phyllobacterium zundukense]ATU91770.1 hypothetical protein BLM14_09160 [Phyllobacterium zundukense]PIO46764.1 hypothetical protein B5P45_02915 [Phyllobacterium zundukense]